MCITSSFVTCVSGERRCRIFVVSVNCTDDVSTRFTRPNENINENIVYRVTPVKSTTGTPRVTLISASPHTLAERQRETSRRPQPHGNISQPSAHATSHCVSLLRYSTLLFNLWQPQTLATAPWSPVVRPSAARRSLARAKCRSSKRTPKRPRPRRARAACSAPSRAPPCASPAARSASRQVAATRVRARARRAAPGCRDRSCDPSSRCGAA